jgi:hypothetical protein
MSMDPADPVDRAVAAPLRELDTAVDDVLAARLFAGVEAQLDAPARVASRRRGIDRRRRAVAGGAILAAAAAAAAVVLILVPRPTRRTAAPRRTTAVVEAGARAGDKDGQPLALAPYFYAGPGATPAALTAAARLVVPAGGRLRATVGVRARLTLIGPGAISAATTAGGVTELSLERGTLLVDYDRRQGGTLKVRSPGAVTTVVGTLFSVATRDTGDGPSSRVAVARGKVAVETPRGARQSIAAGWCWDAREAALTALPSDLAAALAEHDASPPPPIGDYRIVTYAPGTPVHPARVGPMMPLVARVAIGSAGAPRGPQDTAHHRAATVPHAVAEAAPAVASTPAPPADAEAQYLAAEALMRAGSIARARAVLLDLLERHAGDPHAEAARIDLARMALDDGDPAQASRLMSRLRDPPHDPALAQPARHLRCRIERATDGDGGGDGTHRSCP